jgi:hypothetical protein
MEFPASIECVLDIRLVLQPRVGHPSELARQDYDIDSEDDEEESNVQAEELFSYLPDVSTSTAWAPSWSMTVESPQ